MSTRSAIIIKVKREDIGKVVKFDKTKLPTKLSEWGNESSKEMSEEVTLNMPYIGIYCHSDGDFNGVGAVLKEVFNDYGKVLNLIVGGYCSLVWYNEVRHYANRNGEKWNWVKPQKAETASEVADKIGHDGYVYLFDDNHWKAKKGIDFVEYDEKSESE